MGAVYFSVGFLKASVFASDQIKIMAYYVSMCVPLTFEDLLFLVGDTAARGQNTLSQKTLYIIINRFPFFKIKNCTCKSIISVTHFRFISVFSQENDDDGVKL